MRNMRWIVLLLGLAACDASPCEDAVLLTPCPECGPGQVRAGMTAGGGSGSVVRPGGGVARIGCETHLVRHDAAFAVDTDVGLYLQGAPELQGVTADDVALVVDRLEGGSELVAVARSGTEVWRISTAASDIGMTAAGEQVIVYGHTDEPLGFGDFTVQGLFAVALGAGDGQPRWAWSSPQDAEATITAAGADDGSVLIGGIFAGALELGGTSPPLSTGAAAGFVGMLDASGAGVWARQLIGPAASDVAVVARAPDGAAVIAGGFSGGTLDLDTVVLRPGGAASDQFVAVLEADGASRWGMLLGDALSEPIAAMAATDSAIVVGGGNLDPLSFGGDTIPQQLDGWIAALADGSVAWLIQLGGAGTQAVASLGWNGALHASVVQYAADGDPPASLDFHDASLEGDGVLHIELAP